MSEELFEVAFSGEIADGADLEQVKAKVGVMFKADAAKLAHLFSGKRMVIKKNIDLLTANKYKAALTKAGAVCEVKSLSEPAAPAAITSAPAKPVVPEATSTQSTAKPTSPKPATSAAVISGGVPAAPQTAPLGVTANDISDLSANLAPIGSDMQDSIKTVAEPELDISGLGIAPPGSDLGQAKKDDDPPPPDITGLTMAD